MKRINRDGVFCGNSTLMEGRGKEQGTQCRPRLTGFVLSRGRGEGTTKLLKCIQGELTIIIISSLPDLNSTVYSRHTHTQLSYDIFILFTQKKQNSVLLFKTKLRICRMLCIEKPGNLFCWFFTAWPGRTYGTRLGSQPIHSWCLLMTLASCINVIYEFILEMANDFDTMKIF